MGELKITPVDPLSDFGSGKVYFGFVYPPFELGEFGDHYVWVGPDAPVRNIGENKTSCVVCKKEKGTGWAVLWYI